LGGVGSKAESNVLAADFQRILTTQEDNLVAFYGNSLVLDGRWCVTDDGERVELGQSCRDPWLGTRRL